MALSGLSFVKENNSFYCRIDVLSDELKQKIREQLGSVWSGFANIEDLPEIYSYRRTLESFLDRYRSKSEETQKGMIGELLAHILIPEEFPQFHSLSVLKNKEERSIKKGFDIIYYKEDVLWYSEVKSGRSESRSHNSNEYNEVLLDRAHKGISQMFESERSSLWESALIDVKLCINSRDKVVELSKLLDNDSPVHQSSDKKNVILISVLYHCPSDPILLEKVVGFKNKVASEDCYLDSIVFSIQKKTFEAIATFLELELANHD
ncbi:hypothetical protein GCM10022289_23550 [Pedobacter jeongneungensis]|uniref:Anti-bacteriophage protein A/HamA C-terminal domain-containing protein n=1 Tax=Pedobacter jeongneungensis TaxID=947309 RepID=A0ABP8BEC6_9SPHI